MKKIAVFMLAVCMMTPYISAFSAWDGYVIKETNAETIVDMSNIGTIIESGGMPSRSKLSTAAYSTHWYDQTKNNEVLFKKVKRDWSDYEAITMNIYSEKATGGEIVMIAYSDYVPSDVFNVSYFSDRFTVNWTGWKSVTLNFNDFNNSNHASFEKMKSLGFTCNGWNAKPVDGTELYIDSIYGVAKTEEFSQSDVYFTDSEIKTFNDAMKGGILLLNESRHVLSDGMVSSLDANNENVKTTMLNKKIILPLTFFPKYIGATVTETDKSYKLSLDNVDVELQKNGEGLTVNGETQNLPAKPYYEDSFFYVPLETVLNAFGKTMKEFDEFVFIGTQEQISELEKNRRLRDTGAEMLAGSAMNISNITDEDFELARDKWRKYLVGDENVDVTNELVQKKIARIDSLCKGAWDTYNHGENVTVLFGKEAVTSTKNMRNQFDYIETLAKAYGTYGSKYYKNKTLKKDILNGLNWLYENLYGEDEIKGTGWRSTELFDWYDWYSGSALPLCNTLLIMHDDLYQEKINKYLSLHNHLRTKMRTEMSQGDAASRIYPCTASAILQNNKKLFEDNIIDFKLTAKKAGSNLTGIKDDYMYICHDYFPYTSLYGVAVLLRYYTPIKSALEGTKFEMDNQYIYEPAKWIYYTFAPVTWDGGLMKSCMGRNVLDEELLWGAFALKSALALIGMYGSDDDKRLKEYVKQNINKNSLNSTIEWVNMDELTKLIEIINDDTIQTDKPNSNKVYYEGDRVMHFRKNYGISLAMSSSRIGNYECIDQVNRKGWYTGDGMVYTYMHDDPQQYGAVYYNNANMYHMPGTTVDTQKQEEASIIYPYLSHQDFVGAAGDGMYATAAMKLESYHQEELEDSEKSEYGGPKPLHNCSLVANKGWFMFDDEIVCLGSGINASDGFEVQTILENRALKKTKKLEKTNTAVSEYSPVKITAVGDDGNVAQNVSDNNFGTRWSFAGTENAWLLLELDDVHELGWMGIAFYNGKAGNKNSFKIEASQDGQNYTTVYDGTSKTDTDELQGFDMGGIKAKYIRYNGRGSQRSVWNSITEIKFYGKTEDGLFPTAGTSGDTIYGAEDITVDGAIIEKSASYEKRFDSARWCHIENLGGFFFPQASNLQLAKRAGQPGFIELWTSHGISPQNEKYAYVMLPSKTAAETEAYAKNPEVEVLSNDDKLQAVRQKKLDIIGMIFWNEGSCEQYTASQPMIVIAKRENGKCTLSISDPTKKLEKATLSVENAQGIISCDDMITSKNNGKTLEIDFSGSRGRTLTAELNIK